MPSIAENLLSRLTSRYNRNPDSKIGKLLKMVADELEEILVTTNTVELYRDVDHAEGVTLDRTGNNVQQPRGVATDPVYRILIKSKIARNMSEGDINTIIEVLAITLDTEFEDIFVREEYDSLDDPEPAAIFVSVPTVLLNQAGFSINQFGRLVNTIVAGGVRAMVLFQGTFSFSSQAAVSETDPAAGFADTGQTTGGFFGGVYDPANDENLPI